MTLEPAEGATVPAGTPVAFSGGSLYDAHTPTFSVASSPALLSSPDIDSGTGSQVGSSYAFTSAKATATPRTIYWTASFTFTPAGCESPSTFTTPVRILIVEPSPAEEAAAKKKQEEEAAAIAAAKKLQEAAEMAAGGVSLDGSTIIVRSGGVARVKLTCAGAGMCVGKLTVTARGTARKGRKTKAGAKTLGTVGFSIAAGRNTTVRLTLNPSGRALLRSSHRRLDAMLTLLQSSPAPSHMHIDNVRLVQHKPR